MVLFGVIIGWFLPGVLMAVVNFLKVNFPWNFLVFFIIFFPAAIAYSIVRHNLFDADVIIKRTVGYAVVTAVVVAAYSGVSVVLNVFAGQYRWRNHRHSRSCSPLGSFLSSIRCATGFNLLWTASFSGRNTSQGRLLTRWAAP
jgi:hypothetical protein